MTPDEFMVRISGTDNGSAMTSHADYLATFWSYRAFLAGANWAVDHGYICGDDAEHAWQEWLEHPAPRPM